MEESIQKTKCYETNRRFWEEATALHIEPNDYYNITGFMEGVLSLRPLEIKEVGSISGRSLLHLQCHLGLDTLSWNRLGAIVTGVDFSESSIAYARRLANMTGIEASFVCCNLYEIPRHLSNKFDVVFTSYGAIRWLHDLRRWAEIAFDLINPGGFLYVVDTHPLVLDQTTFEHKIVRPNGSSLSFAEQPPEVGFSFDYAQKEVEIQTIRYVWNHSLEHIIDAISKTGFQLDFVREHQFCDDAYLPRMIKNVQGWWVFSENTSHLPLMFSLKASRSKV